jgi:hypothetical protein
MPTDDELTTLLRRGFARATADLDPEPDLVHVVRRRYVSARRRRFVVRVAVPAAALAAGSGFALAARDTPGHTAVAVSPPSAPASSVSAPRTTPVRPVPFKPASYRVLSINRSAPPNCPANATAPVGKSESPAGVWFHTKKGTCVFVGISLADTRPADAAPVHINGYPGLYSTLENGVRMIYAPAPNPHDPKGQWLVLTLPANAPQETAVRMIIVPS